MLHRNLIMKSRHKVLGLLCLLAAITYLDRVAISVAGPRIQESLHISPEAWGWAVGTGVLWGLSYFFWRRLEAAPAKA